MQRYAYFYACHHSCRTENELINTQATVDYDIALKRVYAIQNPKGTSPASANKRHHFYLFCSMMKDTVHR
jgi:hypothetical protein